MNFEVLSLSKHRTELITHAVKVYIRCLNLTNSRYGLKVITSTNLVKLSGMNGSSWESPDEKAMVISLDSRLPHKVMLQTLAHEMVHVKQVVKGQLIHRRRRTGSIEARWRGKVCNKPYYDRPWEIEAFSKERLLLNEYIKSVSKRKKNGES